VGKTTIKAHLQKQVVSDESELPVFFASVFVVIFVIWFLFLATVFALKGRDFSPTVPALLLVWL
jgi:hypothetical protein